MMSFVVLTVLLASPGDWNLVGDVGGVKVYRRDRPGSEVKEMKAIGLIEATPGEVWQAVRDLDNYAKQMPYTAEAKVLTRSEDGKDILFYSRLNTPIVNERDYIIAMKDESDWQGGEGFYKMSWTVAPKEQDSLAPERPNVVRVRINDGHWLLEPRNDGKSTLTTYYLYTAPGGSIPVFIINNANGIAVPKVFEAIKKTVLDKRKAKK